MASANQTKIKGFIMSKNFYNLFSINSKNLAINSDNLNTGGIFLCVCNELLGSKVKDANDLRSKIIQSNSLDFVKKSLFTKLQAARKSKTTDSSDTFEKISSYDDEDIYMDNAGNRVDLSALTVMEEVLVEDICEYADDWGISIFNLNDGEAGFDRVIKVVMQKYPTNIEISNYQVITANDKEEGDYDGADFAVDVTVKLYGSEWVVQTWNGSITDDCQTTVDGHYIELHNPNFSERLIEAVYTVCCAFAQDTISKDVATKKQSAQANQKQDSRNE